MLHLVLHVIYSVDKTRRSIARSQTFTFFLSLSFENQFNWDCLCLFVFMPSRKNGPVFLNECAVCFLVIDHSKSGEKFQSCNLSSR